MLDALGVAAATEDERTPRWPPTTATTGTLAAADGRRPCRPASSFWVHVTHGDPVGVWLRLEDGTVRTGLRQLENNRPPYDLGDR